MIIYICKLNTKHIITKVPHTAQATDSPNHQTDVQIIRVNIPTEKTYTMCVLSFYVSYYAFTHIFALQHE